MAKPTTIDLNNVIRGISITASKNEVTIYRERRATKEERQKDKDAATMDEAVTITFGNQEPEVTINRSLCSKE